VFPSTYRHCSTASYFITIYGEAVQKIFSQKADGSGKKQQQNAEIILISINRWGILKIIVTHTG
jgi:hypothetical protein